MSHVLDVATGQMRVGRFGWKAQPATLLSFSADAYLNEMGITIRLFPTENAPNGNAALLGAVRCVRRSRGSDRTGHTEGRHRCGGGFHAMARTAADPDSEPGCGRGRGHVLAGRVCGLAPLGFRDITIQNVRRYKSSIDDSEWVYFDVLAGVSLRAFTLQVRLRYADGTFRVCNQYVPAMTPGEWHEGLIIPSICGPDVQWAAIEIVPPANLTCAGCGVYAALGIVEGRAIPPLASDSALEADRVIEDYRRRSTIGR